MPKTPINQVCIGNKNLSTLKTGLTGQATPERTRRWDGRFRRINTTTYLCSLDGRGLECGIGHLNPSSGSTSTACKVDTGNTTIIKSGNVWTLQICGLDRSNQPFVIWSGVSHRRNPSVLGVYTQNAIPQTDPYDPQNPSRIEIVAK